MRFGWIDIAKGLGIILVVVGHTKCSNIDFIYSFHMPLFFIIAGFLLNSIKWKGNIREFIINKFCRLMVPYFFSCVLFYIFWIIIGRNYGETSEKSISLVKPLLGVFYGNGFDNWLIFNTPLWFLPCLYVSEILFIWQIKVYGTCIKRLSASVIATAIIGYCLSVNSIYLPWGADIALISQVFLFVGYLIRTNNSISIKMNKNILFAIGCIICLTVSYFVNGRVDMNGRQFQKIFLFYLGGIAGSYLTFMVSHMLEKTRWLCKITKICGKETLIILVFHAFTFKVVSSILVFVMHMQLKFAQQSYWFIYSVFGVIFPIVFGLVIKNIRFGKKIFYYVE